MRIRGVAARVVPVCQSKLTMEQGAFSYRFCDMSFLGGFKHHHEGGSCHGNSPVFVIFNGV